MLTVTQHAFERGKERMGWNRKALSRMAQRAYDDGKERRAYKGDFRAYLDDLYNRHEGRRRRVRLMIYGYNIYVFLRDNLVTVMQVPREYRSAAWGHDKI